jgi:hypothetical protein
MPQSPTGIPSVITVENTDGMILSVKFSWKIFFLARLAVCNTVGVWFFLIPDRISNEMKNYRRSIFQRTNFVGEAVGKNVTNFLCASHRRNESVGKTV